MISNHQIKKNDEKIFFVTLIHRDADYQVPEGLMHLQYKATNFGYAASLYLRYAMSGNIVINYFFALSHNFWYLVLPLAFYNDKVVRSCQIKKNDVMKQFLTIIKVVKTSNENEVNVIYGQLVMVFLLIHQNYKRD